MRKITSEAMAAFLSGRNYRKDNTEVVSVWDGITGKHKFTGLYLHNNLIVQKKTNGRTYITTAGWDTTTTKERLNGLPGVQVSHSDKQLYLNGKKWDGKWKRV